MRFEDVASYWHKDSLTYHSGQTTRLPRHCDERPCRFPRRFLEGGHGSLAVVPLCRFGDFWSRVTPHAALVGQVQYTLLIDTGALCYLSLSKSRVCVGACGCVWVLMVRVIALLQRARTPGLVPAEVLFTRHLAPLRPAFPL